MVLDQEGSCGFVSSYFSDFLWLNLEVLVEIVDELEDEELSEGGEAS